MVYHHGINCVYNGDGWWFVTDGVRACRFTFKEYDELRWMSNYCTEEELRLWYINKWRRTTC